MTHTALKTLSNDLHAFADEASDHLKDAAKKTGTGRDRRRRPIDQGHHARGRSPA